MNGGPLSGRIMAYGGPVMPAIVDGARVGTYIWDEDHWEYEKDSKGFMELFTEGY